MKSGASYFNDSLDMISTSTTAESRSCSTNNDESRSPRVSKESWTSSRKQGVQRPIDVDECGAPSDEEVGLSGTRNVRRHWEQKEKIAKSLSPGNPLEAADDDDVSANPKNPAYQSSKLTWDGKTAKLTKKRVDLLGSSSWHGPRRTREPLQKNNSAPKRKGTRRDFVEQGTDGKEKKDELGVISIPGVFQKPESSTKDEEQDTTLGHSHGSLEIPSAFLQGRKKPASDDISIGVPSPSNAKNKFISESTADFESSTTSFLAELPSISTRRGHEGTTSMASSIVRGGRVIKVQAPTGHAMSSFLPPNSTPRSSKFPNKTPPNKPLSSHTQGSSVSNDSTDGDITEYDSVVPGIRGPVVRSESGSSHKLSVGTYEDEDVVNNWGMPLQPIASGSQEEEEVEFEPLKDESQRKMSPDTDDYEEDLEDADLGNEDLVVDKVPKKRRWCSKNIDNFPVWPPIIKVKTWERKNVSAVSVGSGFSPIDDSFTDSNAVVSSLGYDDYSYADEDLIRRPPARQTSYRIRYDGPTKLALQDIYRAPPAKSDDRFDATGKPADGLPCMPARRVVDAAPSAPPRASASSDLDDVSLSLSQAEDEEKRPDVWITPLANSLSAEAMWKVKRVWAVKAEDEKELEHDVRNHDLFEKIKSLVGALQAPAFENPEDNAPRLPQRSWHVQTVVEKKGRVENVAAEKDFSKEELADDMVEMAKEAVKEIEENQKAFEEYKKKREERRAEQGALADFEPDYEYLEESETLEPRVFAFANAVDEDQYHPEQAAPREQSDDPRYDISPKDVEKTVDREDESVPSSGSDPEAWGDVKDDAPVKRRGKRPKKSNVSKSVSSSPKRSESLQKAESLRSPSTPRKSSKKPTKSVSNPTPKKPSRLKVEPDSVDISPKSCRKSKSSLDAPLSSTPRKNSKGKVISPKAKKSPEKEKKKKSKAKTKSKRSPEMVKEKQNHKSKRSLVPMAALVHDSSNDLLSSASDEVYANSPVGEGACLPHENFGKLAAPANKKNAVRLSLAAMVHDSSESDLESEGSDDSSFGGENEGDVPPNQQQQAGVSPRPRWWKNDVWNTSKTSSRRRLGHSSEGCARNPQLTKGDTSRSPSKSG